MNRTTLIVILVLLVVVFATICILLKVYRKPYDIILFGYHCDQMAYVLRKQGNRTKIVKGHWRNHLDLFKNSSLKAVWISWNFLPFDFSILQPSTRVNYVSCMRGWGNKTNALSRLYGSKVKCPPTLLLYPDSIDKVKKEHFPPKPWILKPCCAGKAKDTILPTSIEEILNHVKTKPYSSFVCQTLVEPLLIDNCKFHVRIEVAIDHLHNAYLYDNSEVALSGSPYSPENYSSVITNFAVQRKVHGDKVAHALWKIQKQFPQINRLKSKWINLVIHFVGRVFELSPLSKSNQASFQFFGIDVMFDNEENAIFLESNIDTYLKEETNEGKMRMADCLDGLYRRVFKDSPTDFTDWIQLYRHGLLVYTQV